MKVATTKIEPKPWTSVQGPRMESPPAIPVIILGILHNRDPGRVTLLEGEPDNPTDWLYDISPRGL